VLGFLLPRSEWVTRPSQNRHRARLTNVQIILIVVAVVGLRLVFDFSQRIVEGQRMVAEQRQLEAEIEALLEEQALLEAMKLYYGSDAFVEAWAHDEGKMVREGEVLVIPIPLGEPAPTTAPSETPVTSLPPWHVWWLLFFDSPPPFDLGQ
jgi:cell division protein FtsB